MLSSLVLAAVLSAAPAPRAATAARTVVHVPKLDAMSGLSAFLGRAGETSALLRPAAWRAELPPFLVVDPTQPKTLTEAGLDAAGPATVSIRADGRVSCMRVADVKTFQARAAEALSAAGATTAVKPVTVKGVTTVDATRSAGGRMGYALKGQEVCAFGGTDEAGAALLKESVKLVGKSPAPDARMGALPGVAFIVSGGTVLGLDGTATSLQVHGASAKLPLPAFQSQGSSPYGAMKPSGLLFSRVALAPAGVSQAVDSLRATVQVICPTCPAEQVRAMTDAVARQLTGHVLVDVDRAQARGTLRTREGRFFALKQALAAEVTDAAAVKTTLAPLAGFPGAKPLADGWVFTAKGGSIWVRLKGRQLVVGNDEAVTQSVLAALPETAAKLERPVDFTVDPKVLARGLAQVSLTDVPANEMLAGLYFLSAELGPLLTRSERISGWMEGGAAGTHRFFVTWLLPEGA